MTQLLEKEVSSDTIVEPTLYRIKVIARLWSHCDCSSQSS